MSDMREQHRLARRAADTRRRRKNRGDELGYTPSDMPSLSAIRALAQMYRTGRYTTQQVHDLTQSDQPADVLRQLHLRQYVSSTGIGTGKRWALTREGSRRAEKLRADGFCDFRPPKTPPRLSPEDLYPATRVTRSAAPPRCNPPEPVLSRAAQRQFKAGAPADRYLTPTQQRLLKAVASESGGRMGGKPRERTVNALVRFKLVERTPEGFRITEDGQRAMKELS